MSTETYTQAELEEFDRIISMCDSLRQMDRIEGRFEMRDFVEKHGKEKCDAMFAKLTRVRVPSEHKASGSCSVAQR